MPIVYDKLWKMLKERGITTYDIQKSKILARGTERAMKAHTSGPDYKVLCRLCEILECQPGDIMEFIPEREWEKLHPKQNNENEKERSKDR